MSQQFCLKWNNHMNNMMDVFKNLLSTEAMVDVTLACDGLSLKAHKIVLSACSPFFQSLFLENPCKHPIVILKDMKYTELKAIIEFMYHGEVNVAQDQLSALMKTAETLRVKGLAEVTNEKNQSGDESSHRSVSRTDTPPPKRRRGRTRKRSLSDQSDDGASEPKIKQPDSDIEELSGDMDPSTPYSTASTVPLQSHSTNSFHKSQQDQPVEQGADESFAPEEKFGVEPSKLLEQTLTTDDLPRRSGRSSVQSNMELQRRPRSSTDHSTSLVPVTSTPMSSDALVVANQQPESPPDIKPELLDLEPPMSPVAGPSHSTDENSMMMYMDQSSMSTMPGPSGYQDNSALVSTDSQPQEITVEQVLPDVLMLSSPAPAAPTLAAKEQINICISNVGTLKTGTYSVNIPPLIHPKWDQHFEIDWSYLPRGIAECLNKGKRLDPRDKREFVRFVSRSITDVCPKPKRRNLVNIIEKIVDTFPKSLADTWCAETAGNGYESLLRKVITRIENLNRNPSSVRFSRNSGEKKKRHPGYKTYGCSNFEPEIIEDEDDLEKKKEVMKEMYANSNRDVSVIVKTLLKQTYKLQRREINQGRDINQLIADWPYLFTMEGLLVHFIELVGIDIRSKLGNVLGMKGSSIIAFMSQFTEKSYKKEKLKNTLFELLSSGVKIEDELISDMSGILMLIMQYFEETKESLYMIIENAVPSNEVESIINMQEISSPLIIVQGQSEFSYDSCMLYAKGKIIMEGIKTFKDAFICLFCLYYCLNIDYPLSAAATLEFIQRCFFGINPDYGGKVQKRMKWRMNTKVTRLIEMLSEYDPGCANF